MLAEASSSMNEHGVASVKTGFRAPIPNWWPAAGDVDLVLEAAIPDHRRFDLYELKWCNHNKMEEALWDAVKMLNAHQLPEVRNTYLVFAAPARWWKDDVVGVKCFDPRESSMAEILDAHPQRWRAVMNGGTGRPNSVPERISIKVVDELQIEVADSLYEIRAVDIRPRGSNTLSLT